MSCFWDTLKQSKLFKVKSSIEIIKFLKNNNTKSNCIVNRHKISNKQIIENFNAISCLDSKTHKNGYFTSMCEPVLCLICHLFNIHIIHEWHLKSKHIISYSPVKSINEKKKILVIHSSNNHAWFGKMIS